jgi:hypothetical protein
MWVDAGVGEWGTDTHVHVSSMCVHVMPVAWHHDVDLLYMHSPRSL